MAKGFPFFKFVSAKWLSGSIVLEDLETQGLFINICALYWERDGDLTIDDINRRFKTPDSLKRLIGYFIQESNGSINIEFLDEQLSDANHISSENSEKGKKSAMKRANLLKNPTTVEPVMNKVNKSKEELNKILKEEFEFISPDFKTIFLRWLNYKNERKEKYKSDDSLKTCYKKLVRFSNNNPVVAEKIIDDAIGNNYAGFFEPKIPINTIQKSEIKDLTWNP